MGGMRSRAGYALLSLLSYFGVFFEAGAEQWTNSDGKTIAADFVRVDQTIGVVGLRQSATTYQVALKSLDEASRSKALRLQERKAAWAEAQSRFSVIPEEVLLDLARFDPTKFHMRHFVVKGNVAKITTIGLNTGQPLIELESGTEVPVQVLWSRGDDRFKLQVLEDAIIINEVIQDSGLKKFRHYRTVATLGQAVLVRVQVQGDRMVGIGLLDEADAQQALLGGVATSFQSFSANPFSGVLKPASAPTPAAAPKAGGSSPTAFEGFVKWALGLMGK